MGCIDGIQAAVKMAMVLHHCQGTIRKTRVLKIKQFKLGLFEDYYILHVMSAGLTDSR